MRSILRDASLRDAPEDEAERCSPKPVKLRRVLDQDAVARGVVRRPLAQQVEQHRVVGLFVLGRMRPVAAPHHALGRGRDIRPRHLAGVRIGRRPAEKIRAGKLHPGAAAVEHPADDAEGRMVQSLRRRQAAEMIEHDRARQTQQQILGGDDLVGAQMNLHMPAERLHAPRQRLDHVHRRGRGLRIELRETDAAHAAVRHALELGVGDGRMHHRDAARGRAKLRDGVERHLVVGEIGGRRHHDHAARPDALLQQPVVRDAGVRLHPRLRPRRRKASAVIDMHVAVARIVRRR